VLGPTGTEVDGVIVISDIDVDGRGRPHGACVVDGSRNATLLGVVRAAEITAACFLIFICWIE
jgi:hypothetical protein